MNQSKLDLKLARLLKKFKGKFYKHSGEAGVESFLKVNNFTIHEGRALAVCFTIVKTPTMGYLLQYTYLTESELNNLAEISEDAFMEALELMRVWVDMGTLYDE